MKISISDNHVLDAPGVCPKCRCNKWFTKKFYAPGQVIRKKQCKECGCVYK